MRLLNSIFLVLFFFTACGSTIPEPKDGDEYYLPDPLFDPGLPDPPEPAPPGQERVVGVDECIIEGSNPPELTSPGIYMTQETAMAVARLKVAYDELRGLYIVDIRTMDRERAIYERYLKIAENESNEWQKKARRSWWEEHGPQVMLGVGIVLGIGASVGIAAALDLATD